MLTITKSEIATLNGTFFETLGKVAPRLNWVGWVSRRVSRFNKKGFRAFDVKTNLEISICLAADNQNWQYLKCVVVDHLYRWGRKTICQVSVHQNEKFFETLLGVFRLVESIGQVKPGDNDTLSSAHSLREATKLIQHAHGVH